MNKTITVILVILVVIGGFFLFFNKSNAPVADNTQETLSDTNAAEASPKVNGVQVEAGAKMETGVIETAKEFTVTYTNSGFSPKSIAIKKGDTITFVNESADSMWVASNPHPTHTIYPAFDEKASVSKGSSWSFTFDKTGSWGYHNHKNSSNTGTIVVE